MATLLMFSGGLDSTGVFWKLIHEKEKLYVHHMNLINKENRHRAEKIAVKNICEYMKKIGNFEYSESTHEYPTFNKSFMWDSDIFSFMAGSICLCLREIKKIAIGLTATDKNRNFSTRTERSNKILEAFTKDIKKIYPVSDMNKAQIYDMMPKELSNMTWSCRCPVYNNNLIIKCGKCRSCNETSGLNLGNLILK